MNADELIALLQECPAEWRQWPLVTHDGFGGYGEVASLRRAELSDDDDNRQRCLFIVVTERPHESVELEPSQMRLP
jgi:hypothetical protein